MTIQISHQSIITATAQYIEEVMRADNTGHDWWHIYRVWKMAQHLCTHEKTPDPFLVEMAALLHDLEDWKLTLKRPFGVREWLQHQKVAPDTIQAIINIIDQVSFKGANVQDRPTSIEAKIVQDADRLDAIGAIGIARTFTYGAVKNRPLYDPKVPPHLHDSYEQYKKNQTHTINHFYEKLLLLKDRMHTLEAKRIAAHRHQVMENFLQEFLQEWAI